jgi:hypothetical protein
MSASGRNAASTISLHRSKTDQRTKTMFSTVMKAFDRASLSIFMSLALLPMLAVAVAASIH